ncbi:hypothetical protein [Bradymonas sediminis]|uniref:Uncharacterized protein n=1 Tax=Bradymonas sediminis TaxID=1548548 RepID=A0A2Z4FIH0_9DELT|nr:hypothetical protein [Bradymonas sediminis]AWV88524.1 hypothetical protein DN745_03865 [Bradymonas sediminis]TDP77662.1 hypothetical protein DFR33_101567 [Bradymonas sediminis]
MSNKVDGGQSSFDQAADAISGFFGIGEEPDACANTAPQTPQKPGPDTAQDGDALDQLGDVAGTFWNEMTGAAGRAAGDAAKIVGGAVNEVVNDAAKSVEQVVHGAAEEISTTVDSVQRGIHEAVDKTTKAAVKEVRDEVNQAVEDLHKIAEVPADILGAAKEVFLAAEEIKVEFAESLDKVIEQYPEEVLADFALEVLDGAVDLAGDVASGVADYALDAVIEAVDRDTAESDELRDQVTKVAVEFVTAHREVIDDAADLVTSALTSEIADAYLSIMPPMAGGLQAKACRAAWLQVAAGVKSSTRVAEQLANNPAQRQALTRTPTAQDISARLERLSVNETADTSTGLNLEFHSGVGGEVGQAFQTSVARTGPETYQVSFDLSRSGGIGVGEKLQALGFSGNFVASLQGKTTLEVSGPNAAYNAALLVAASNGTIADLLRLKDLTGVTLVSGALGRGAAVDLDAFSGKFNAGADIEARYMSIDGQMHHGVTATIKAKIGIDSGGIQLGDELSEAYLNDPSTGAPAIDALLDVVPNTLVTDLKKVYGPTAKLTLLAEPSISASLFAPEGQLSPIRAEIAVQMDLQVGRSTLKASNSLVIPDVGKLAKAIGMSVDDLSKKLSSGELSAQDLQKNYSNIEGLIESGGPEVVLETVDQFSVNALGFHFSDGTTTRTTIYAPPEYEGGTIGAQLRTAYQKEQATDQPQPAPDPLASAARQSQLSAHSAVRV